LNKGKAMRPLDRPYARLLVAVAVAYLAFGLLAVALNLKGRLGLAGWGGLSDLFSPNWPEVLYVLGLFILLVFVFMVFGEAEDREAA